MSKGAQSKKRNKATSPKVSGQPEQKKLSISISDKIQIFIAFTSFLSILGVLFTLNEMKKDRDAAYKPAVLMNATDFQIAWNTSREENWVSSLPDKEDSSYEVNADGSVTGTYSLPINIFPNGKLESFTAVNIGVGTARDVCFEWDERNLCLLSDYLTTCDPSKSDFCTFGESVAFSFDEQLIITDLAHSTRLMYMLPGAAETYTLPLPTAYSILIHEIMKCPILPENLHIVLYAEYFDIQGKHSRDTIDIAINRVSYEEGLDGSGAATYQLTPTLLIG